MRKIISVLLLSAVCMLAFAKGNQAQKINYFVDEFSKEYGISEAQKVELHKKRTAYVDEYIKLTKEVKSGTITREQQKPNFNKLNRNFNTMLAEMTGKTIKELQPVLSEIRNGMKEL